jgi:hypothetical protein
LDGLSEEVKTLRPDMIFKRRGDAGEEINEMLEFSCLYGYISQERDTMKESYEGKKKKYAQLATESRQVNGLQVKVGAIIVSSIRSPEMVDGHTEGMGI